MSLGGIAVAIGALVDAAVVVVENAHKKLEVWEATGRKGDYKEVLIDAIQEVGRPSFFSLLVIAVAFMPIFALEAQEGRLFRPLAFTKNFAMAIAAILAITLDPAIRLLFTRLKNYDFKPRWLCRIANAVARREDAPRGEAPDLPRPLPSLRAAGEVRAAPSEARDRIGAPRRARARSRSIKRLGSEFMPPLNEGSILYMPTTLPGHLRHGRRRRSCRGRIRFSKSFPEVERVFGKAGRAETSTDPAPFSMMETVVILKPEGEWRTKSRWYSSWFPGFLKPIVRPLWPETISWDELVNEMNARLQLPGPDQRLDDADQEPHRHAHDRHPHAGRHQDLRLRPEADREDRPPARTDPPEGPRHA